jgi:hypothetical protein
MWLSMSAGSERSTQARVGADSPSIVVVGLAVFAAVQLGLALFMASSPHGFFTDVGPFGTYNGHYIRDVATFYGASGIGLVVAIRQASWRVPMLALITIQYALHSLNHLLDISRADPGWVGYLDFFALAAATLQLAGLTWMALALARAESSAHISQGGAT